MMQSRTVCFQLGFCDVFLCHAEKFNYSLQALQCKFITMIVKGSLRVLMGFAEVMT